MRLRMCSTWMTWASWHLTRWSRSSSMWWYCSWRTSMRTIHCLPHQIVIGCTVRIKHMMSCMVSSVGMVLLHQSGICWISSRSNWITCKLCCLHGGSRRMASCRRMMVVTTTRRRWRSRSIRPTCSRVTTMMRGN